MAEEVGTNYWSPPVNPPIADMVANLQSEIGKNWQEVLESGLTEEQFVTNALDAWGGPWGWFNVGEPPYDTRDDRICIYVDIDGTWLIDSIVIG